MTNGFRTLLLALGVSGVASQASASIVISFDDTIAQVQDDLTYVGDDQQNTGGTTAQAAIAPDYSSGTTSLFNSAMMSGSFSQTRGGDLDGYSDGWVSSRFTPDVDMSYTAAGSYSNSGGLTYFYGELYDVTADESLFLNEQVSDGGAADFTLGGLDGNPDNTWEGSLTGILLGGHIYEWIANVYTMANSDDDSGATASGSMSLRFGSAVVPEASSLIVWSLIAVSLRITCWWKRSKLAA